MSDTAKVTEIKGTIVLADGSTSEFSLIEDYGWQQWGASNERLGQTVEVLEAMVAGLKDNEGGDFVMASASDEDEPEPDEAEDPIEDEATYKIVRFFKGDSPAKVKKTGLTLAEAKEHCADPKSRSVDDGQTWFEGFTRED